MVRISQVFFGGLGRGCGNSRKRHSWASILLFLNLGVDDTSMFNLSKFIELSICALSCMYAILQFLKLYKLSQWTNMKVIKSNQVGNALGARFYQVYMFQERSCPFESREEEHPVSRGEEGRGGTETHAL